MAHTNFGLYRRKPAKEGGKIYIYYRPYDAHGNRLPGLSTGIEFRGERSLARARAYCEDLYKANRMIRVPSLLFATYAREWFVWDKCPYVKDRRANGTARKPGITEGYVNQMRAYLDNHILPYFGEMALAKINPVLIRTWRLWLREGRVDASGKNIAGLSNKSINNVSSCLRIMTDWAIDSDLISRNPFRGIDQLAVDDDVRGAFSLDQVKVILKDSWASYDAWIFSFTASVTGMRESEVLGIRRESLHEKYIDCDKQFLRGKLAPLKTKDARKIPICKELYDLLDEHTGNRFYTFDRGDGVPLGVNAIVEKFDKAVRAHFPSERDEKSLVFHSLRHFYNTYLQAENVPLNKVDAVIGHRGNKGEMTINYTHWMPEMMPEVYAAHEKLVKLLIV